MSGDNVLKQKRGRACRACKRATSKRSYDRWMAAAPDFRPADLSLADLERLWSKVQRGDGCWLWLDAPNPHGYGTIHIQRRRRLAHKVVYEILVGPVPEGLVLDHLRCDTPLCVNPSHLRPSTQRENILRGNGASAVNARKTHCIHGHEFTPENTVISTVGARRCRACARERRSESHAQANA